MTITNKSISKIRKESALKQYEHLVERHVIKPSHSHYDILDMHAHKSNNVYNQGLYRARQAIFNNKWMNYNALDRSLKQSRDQKDNMIYNSMNNVHLVQQILKLVDQNMKSWKKAKDSYNKSPKKFTGKPKLPTYRKKGGKFVIYVDNQTAKLKDGYVVIRTLDNFKIKLQHQNITKIQQVRIIPKHNRFIVEIVYKTNKVINYKPDNNRYLSIDPGINNLFTMVTNVKGLRPEIINGKPLKSINQYYNKKRAELYQLYDLNKQPKTSKKLSNLTFKRDNKILNFAHEASKYIIEYALSHELNTIIIGHNKDQKREINLGKKTNQNIVSIPHLKLVDIIKYKANLQGIVVIETEESYTSQTSFLDNEEPIAENGNKSRELKGISPINRRIKRGLFQSNSGQIINADVNAAYQIMKKVVPNIFSNIDGIEGLGLNPIKINL